MARYQRIENANTEIAALTVERDQAIDERNQMLDVATRYAEQSDAALHALARLVADDRFDERTGGYPWSSCSFCGGLHFDSPDEEFWPDDVPWSEEEHDRRNEINQALYDAFVEYTDHTPDCPLMLGRAVLANIRGETIDDDCPTPDVCASDERCRGQCW